jgi:hypothetical protein
MQIYPSVLKMQPLPVCGFLTVFRRMPPAFPVAIRRAFLLEVAVVFTCFRSTVIRTRIIGRFVFPRFLTFQKIFRQSSGSIPRTRCFSKRRGSRLTASNRMSSPSSAFTNGKVRMTNCWSRSAHLRCRRILSLYDHVNHLPRDHIPFLIEASSSTKVHFDLV